MAGDGVTLGTGDEALRATVISTVAKWNGEISLLRAETIRFIH